MTLRTAIPEDAPRLWAFKQSFGLLGPVRKDQPFADYAVFAERNGEIVAVMISTANACLYSRDMPTFERIRFFESAFKRMKEMLAAGWKNREAVYEHERNNRKQRELLSA